MPDEIMTSRRQDCPWLHGGGNCASKYSRIHYTFICLSDEPPLTAQEICPIHLQGRLKLSSRTNSWSHYLLSKFLFWLSEKWVTLMQFMCRVKQRWLCTWIWWKTPRVQISPSAKLAFSISRRIKNVCQFETDLKYIYIYIYEMWQSCVCVCIFMYITELFEYLMKQMMKQYWLKSSPWKPHLTTYKTYRICC